MALIRRLALLAAAAEAARRYAQRNPQQAGKLVDQAAEFVDKQTKGRYHSQIDGVAHKAKDLAGISNGADPAGSPHARTEGHPGPGDFGVPSQGKTG